MLRPFLVPPPTPIKTCLDFCVSVTTAKKKDCCASPVSTPPSSLLKTRLRGREGGARPLAWWSANSHSSSSSLVFYNLWISALDTLDPNHPPAGCDRTKQQPPYDDATWQKKSSSLQKFRMANQFSPRQGWRRKISSQLYFLPKRIVPSLSPHFTMRSAEIFVSELGSYMKENVCFKVNFDSFSVRPFLVRRCPLGAGVRLHHLQRGRIEARPIRWDNEKRQQRHVFSLKNKHFLPFKACTSLMRTSGASSSAVWRRREGEGEKY